MMRSLTTTTSRGSEVSPGSMESGWWNVLASARDHEQRHLRRRLNRLGDFRWSPYLGVLLGRVEDHQSFFDQLVRSEEVQPGFLQPLARLVPIETVTSCEGDSLGPRLRASVLGCTERIRNGSFYVRIERRGHKGEIHRHALEQELDQAVRKCLTGRGYASWVDFRDPDVIIAVKIVGNEYGIGCITKAVRERYPFVKVP